MSYLKSFVEAVPVIDQTPEARKGALIVCVGSVVWGYGNYLRKLIVDDISPVLLSFFSAGIVAIALVVVFRLRLSDLRTSFLKHPWHYLGLALTGVALGSSCMFLALRELDLGIAGLLEKLQPILVLVFARVMLKERFPIERLHWIALALVSAYFIAVSNPLDTLSGDISLLGLAGILGAATSWALCTIIGKSLVDQSVPPESIMFFRFFFGSLLLFPFFVFQQQLGLSVEWSYRLVGITVISSVFSSALGFYLFYLGLPRITAGLSAMLELVTPLTGLLLGVAFLGERMTSSQSVAAGALLFAVYSLVKPPASRNCAID